VAPVAPVFYSYPKTSFLRIKIRFLIRGKAECHGVSDMKQEKKTGILG
jgi:hypothetical protein